MRQYFGMAIKTLVVDDLDGSNEATTVAFSLDGVSYQIDLSEKNKTTLFTAMAPYIEAARLVGRRSQSSRGRRGGGGSNTAPIREWALVNGHPVSARGRIPQAVLDAYRSAHPGSA